jgi:type III restriction enzyme
VIFNLSLQEGWDDPLCYFAYIDKSMESNVQVEQVIGRLLRQPGGQHYPSEALNSAHFYVRVDKRGVFNELLAEVGRKLGTEAPGVRLIETSPGKPAPVALLPKEMRTVFETAYETELAIKPIADLMQALNDYRTDDGVNTRSAGGRALIQHVIGDPTISTTFEWKEFEHANMVSARWLFHREIARLFQGVLGLAPTDAPKFDAPVGFGSRAHKQIVTTAHQVVEAYVENVYLKQRRLDPYKVGSVLVRASEMEPFVNALHEGYSGLNGLERIFARALDRLGLTWCRNPSRSGYAVPLISIGTTRNFYPDFLIWKDADVIAVDTTGGHLLHKKTGRKLLSVIPPKNETGKLIIRFVSEGSYNADIERQDKAGYTVWGLKQDGDLRATVVESADDAVERAVS